VAEPHFVRLKRSERHSRGFQVLRQVAIRSRHVRGVLVCENPQDSVDLLGSRGINPLDSSFGHVARHHKSVGDVWHGVFKGVLRIARDLRGPVNPVDGLADIGGCHAVLPIRAACCNARTTARRASSILKVLWAKPCAPRMMVSPTASKWSLVALIPFNMASASRFRHGLWATPPSARRVSVIVSPSIRSAAATDTSANAYEARSRTFRYA